MSGVKKRYRKTLNRKIADIIGVEMGLFLSISFVRRVQEIVHGLDNQRLTVLYYRSITDAIAVTQASRQKTNFVRKANSTAGTSDLLRREAEYHRKNSETVGTASTVMRGLVFVIRIVTQLFIRDYILSRFLKAKSELTLKSCVTREITLESRIA